MDSNFIVLSDDFIYCIGELGNAAKFFVREQKYLHIAKRILGTEEVFVCEKGPYVDYTPIYELRLARKQDISLRRPANFVKLGKFFNIGPIKNDGEPRFPSYASRLCEGIHIQVHKNGKNIVAFHNNGVQITTPSPELSRCLIDIWRIEGVNDAVFNAILVDDILYIFDLLLFEDNQSTYLRRFKTRYGLLLSIKFCGNVYVLPHILVKSKEDIDDLTPGKYIFKWENEKLNIKSPNWYVVSVKNNELINDVDELDSDYVYDKLMNFEQDTSAFDLKIDDNMIIDNKIVLPIANSNINKGSYKAIFGCLIGTKDKFKQEIFIINGNKYSKYYYYNDYNIYETDGDEKLPFILTNNAFDTNINIAKVNIEHMDALENERCISDLPINYEEYMLEFIDYFGDVN